METNLIGRIDPETIEFSSRIIIPALAAIGTITVAVLAIWGEWFRARLAPAKLEIVPHTLTGDLTKIQIIGPSGTVRETSKAYFYHLKIVNKRRWITPLNCRVLLKGMSKRGPDGLFRPIAISVPPQFVWSPAEATPTTVSIELEQVLDFGRIIEGDDKFSPVLYWYSGNFEGFVKAGDAIRYSLQIVSDKFISPKYQVFEVAWNGTWSDVREVMQNHLVIREIVEPVVGV